jgi:cob(I)alamin adenosyltransferase
VSLAKERITSGEYGLVVLDEINNAVHLKLVDLEQVIDLIKSKPPLVHLVLTGRDAAPEIVGLADTVSEVREITHAYRKGIEPQPGIDF